MLFRKGAGYLKYSHANGHIWELLMTDCRWLVEKICGEYDIAPLMEFDEIQ